MEMPNIQALGLSNSQGGQGGPSGSNPLAGMAGMNIGALPMNPALVAAALNQVQQELKRKLIISSMLLLELLLQFVFSLVVVVAAADVVVAELFNSEFFSRPDGDSLATSREDRLDLEEQQPRQGQNTRHSQRQLPSAHQGEMSPQLRYTQWI